MASSIPPTVDLHGETTLLARLRAGEEAAFADFVRDMGPRILGVTRRLLGHEEDAREAVQEAFLSAIKALPSFAGEARLSTWLHRIAVNAALMRLRSARRRNEASLEELLPRFDDGGHHAVIPARWDETRVDAGLEREESRALVRAAIARLPANHRVVLLLRDIEGLDTAESAIVLGISENAVKVRLHRARQALRTLLEPSFCEDAP